MTTVSPESAIDETNGPRERVSATRGTVLTSTPFPRGRTIPSGRIQSATSAGEAVRLAAREPCPCM